MLVQPPAGIGWLASLKIISTCSGKNSPAMPIRLSPGFFNVTGQPAASIPCLRTHDAAPLGSDVGRFGDEATLFGLAAQIEEAQPWRAQLPPVHISNLNLGSRS